MTRALKALILALGLLMALPAALATAATNSDAPSVAAPPSVGGVHAAGTGESDVEPAEGVSTAVNVRVRVDETREDVPGVPVRVLQDGDEVGSGETDASGLVTIEVPDAGEYEVELDLSALGDEYEGLGVPQNPLLTVVDTGRPRTVAFRLTDDPQADRGGGGVSWGTAPQLVAQGLRFGLILALCSIGLSLVFGTTGLTNFSHGELITFGALTAFGLNVVAGLDLLIAAPLAVLLGAAFGWLQDSALWAPLRRRGTGLIAMMIVSIGFAFLLRFSFLYVADGRTKIYSDYTGQGGVPLFGWDAVVLRPADLVTMALAVVVLVLVGLGLLYTRIGRATRAVRDNPALAATSGIDVDRVIRVVWVLGTALAALGGVMLTLAQGANYLTGFQILLLVFASVVLGGLGTAFGAMFGAIVVGLLIEVSTLVVPTEMKNVGALAILILILLVRPQGILGRRERVG